MSTPYRVAIYARVSTKDSGQDVANQLAQLRQFCQVQRWPIVDEYLDQASAKTGDRPQFKALYAGAHQRQFDLVLFWSLDRFSREGVLETLQYLQQLTADGVEWRSFTEQYLDSLGTFRDAVLSILATIAKQERVRISERTLAGLAQARAKGRIGGRPRRVFKRAAVQQLRAQGMSYAAIGRELGISKTLAFRVASPALVDRPTAGAGEGKASLK